MKAKTNTMCTDLKNLKHIIFGITQESQNVLLYRAETNGLRN